MLEFVQGDIFDVPADIRVNTVNCIGVMGAGVALAFKQRYPEMFRDYRDDCKNGQVRPGTMHVWKSLSGDWVINFPTKRDWRDPSRYEDIDAGLDDLRSYLDRVGPVTVALPALGCGNGGLDWKRVSGMIREKLDGVNAHVFVFAPAASRRAGKSSTPATDDERRSTEQLGYELLERERSLDLQVAESVFVKGRQGALSRKWIAILSSRAPGEREIQALRAIAMELANSKADVTIALVYGAKATEEIADLFVRQQVDTVLLLPFGVLTRKPLAKKVAGRNSGSLTIVSAASANAKWSRQLFAQTMDVLRINAAAVILSDPEPDWLANKGLDKWGQAQISYVRYETTPSAVREALGQIGGKAIGRRHDTGAPNIEHLLEAFRPPSPPTSEVAGPTLSGSSEAITDSDTPLEAAAFPLENGETLTINLDQHSEQSRRALFDAMLSMDLKEFAVTVRLQSPTNDRHRRYLLDFGFRENSS